MYENRYRISNREAWGEFEKIRMCQERKKTGFITM